MSTRLALFDYENDMEITEVIEYVGNFVMTSLGLIAITALVIREVPA